MYLIRDTKVMFSRLVGLICGFSSHSPPLKPINIKFISGLNEHILYVEGKDIFIPYGKYPTLLIPPGYSAFLASGQSHSKNIEIHLPCMTYWDNQCFLEIS